MRGDVPIMMVTMTETSEKGRDDENRSSNNVHDRLHTAIRDGVTRAFGLLRD